jgi:hypothetical protein
MQENEGNVSNNMITLNEGQEKAAENIVDFIEGRYDAPFFTLTGAGGTGKSVMLKEALSRTNYYMMNRSAAAVAHAAKNVICEAFDNSIPCYTVAQWLGLKMTYDNDGNILFKPDKRSLVRLEDSYIAILDEVSMINDDLYNRIMSIVKRNRIKLIVVGDIYQLPPVKQEHDSKFFDRIDAELTVPMRFSGYIIDIATVYRNAIKEINDGFAGNPFVLNEITNREDKIDTVTNTGYTFRNNIYEIIDEAADEIMNNPDNINYTRLLAYKNETVRLINKSIRKKIYRGTAAQFEKGEIIISNGGFSIDKSPIINNGMILKVIDAVEMPGPYGIDCISLKIKGINEFDRKMNIPVVSDRKGAISKYNAIKSKLASYAKRDPSQWPAYFKFIESFAYFDYAYSTTLYRAQGQSINNVYVMEGEVMGVKPLNLKQKYQALYVAVTRAREKVHIYNKNY